MSDFKVILPTTTEEWQRDMKLAYSKAITDCAIIAHTLIKCNECPVDCEWGTEESCAENLKNYFMEQLKNDV